MKILHVVHAYPPSMGGSQWLVKNISERLVQDYNDEVTVFTTVAQSTEHFYRNNTPSLPAGIQNENGVIVRRFPVFNKFNFVRKLAAAIFYRLSLPFNDWMRTFENGPIVFGLTNAVAESEAEIILVMAFPLLHMYNALAGAKRAGIPIILVGALHTADRWSYDRPMIIKAIQQADGYIALTKHEKEYLVAKGVSEDKIWVIGAGVDVQAVSDDAKVRYRYEMGLGTYPVLVAIGRHTPRKRFTFLLDAMPIVWQEAPDVQVVIAGAESDYTQILYERVKHLPVEKQKQVHILCDIDDAEKAVLLATADIFVHPAIDESFGIVIIEAWAAGTPVICADTEVNHCLVDVNVDGLLFEQGRADDLAGRILSLIHDREMAWSMGERGLRKVLKQYSWTEVTQQIRKVYKGVVL